MKPKAGVPEIVLAAKDAIWVPSQAATQVVLPSSGQTTAISIKPKTAALCYDRVWAASDDVVPPGIRVWGGTGVEEGGLGLAGNWNIKTNRAPIASMLGPAEKKIAFMTASTEKGLGWTLREIARAFQRQHATAMTPVYDLAEDSETAYEEGTREVIVSVISNLSIVDEKALTWEQVQEFRADQEARQKYRRFLHWLDKEMVGKSQRFVEDAISLRLDDYERALKKHGMRVILGTIEECLDGEYSLGASAACLADTTWGPLVSGLLLATKVGIKLHQKKLEYDDGERGPNSEICWLYDLKNI